MTQHVARMNVVTQPTGCRIQSLPPPSPLTPEAITSEAITSVIMDNADWQIRLSTLTGGKKGQHNKAA